MFRNAFLLAVWTLWSLAACMAADDTGIRWLVHMDGASLPAGAWKAIGTPHAQVTADGLHLRDDSDELGYYRAAWPANGDEEIIVDAVIKFEDSTGAVRNKTSASLWPWRDGAPVSVLVSDGRHQEGLVLFANQAATWTDRFVPMDTRASFHVYRLVIRGQDMSLWVDGERQVEGQGAFWKPADSPEPFIQFGSHAKTATGSAIWSSVKLGVRTPLLPRTEPAVRIAVSPAWEIPRQGVRQTRPYLYDLGRGLLFMSVAQGPDAFYEPYGLLRSVDEGRTWAPIPGLDQLDTTPLPCLRRPDGSILAMSRWTRLQANGSVAGKTVHLDPNGQKFTMVDNQILLPPEYANEKSSDQTVCERHLWNDADGGVTMVLWSRKGVKRPDGRTETVRMSHLVRSLDEGRTWTYFSTIGPGGEPAVVRLSPNEQTAVIRGDRDSCMRQVFSHDGGRTWTSPIRLEVGRVLPDLVQMTNGVLACSYGRPASCLMFSEDGGRTWPAHYVISEKVGFNYTSIREISPGRLLYVHDAPRLQAMYIDVERRGAAR